MGDITTIQDVRVLEKTPLADHHLPGSTYELLARSAAACPSNVALSFFMTASAYRKPYRLTYRHLFRAITRAANMFRALGIARTDVVAFVLPNLPETHLTIWGGEAAGIAMAVNPLLESRQIAALLDAAGAKWLVTLGPTPGADLWEHSIAAARSVRSLRGILAVSLAPHLPRGKRILYRLQAAYRRREARSLNIPVLDFHEQLSRYNSEKLNFSLPKPEDVASYVCTGGTTGLPKIARRRHSSEVYNAWVLTRMSESVYAPTMSIFCGLPLFHVNAQIITGLAPWIKGGQVVMGTPQGYRGRDVVARFWEFVEHYKITAFSGVPTLFASLLQHPVEGHDLSSLKFALCGAAPLSKEIFRSFMTLVGIPIVEGYGLTEGTCVSCANPLTQTPRVGSIGLRMAYQEMLAVVLDGDGRHVRDACPEEVGTLLIRGPNVFAGYVDPLHEKDAWVERNGEIWLNTGDLGRQDKDGYFWLSGRRKELIIRGGHNIDPRSIEEPMQEHPGVAIAAAVGRPDGYAGEVPVLYVQMKADTAANVEELMRFAQSRIAERAAWPKEILVLPALPLTPVGKISKPALSMLEIERCVRDLAAETGASLSVVKVIQDSRRGLVARIGFGRTSKTMEFLAGMEKYTFEYDVFGTNSGGEIDEKYSNAMLDSGALHFSRSNDQHRGKY